MASGWWYSATAAEKLAQIDAAIELGMTGVQCANNCGAIPDTLRSFAADHGRHFDANAYSKGKRSGRIVRWEDGQAVRRRGAPLADAKKAYDCGEPVDFWSVE